MAQKRDVDWAGIRREYESTTASDVELAQRWGFASGTSILRKRTLQGWTRDVDVVADSIARRAVAGTVRGKARLAETGTHTAAAHTRTQGKAPAGKARTGGADLGVGGKTGKNAPRPQPGPTHAMTAQQAARERDEQVRLDTAVDLATIRVQATTQALDAAEVLTTTGLAVVKLIRSIALAERGSPEFEDAQVRLGGLKLDDDVHGVGGKTLSEVGKTFTGMVDTGIKMQAAALGMAVPAKPADAAPAPSAQLLPEQVMQLLSPRMLADWGDLARRSIALRPAPVIDG